MHYKDIAQTEMYCPLDYEGSQKYAAAKRKSLIARGAFKVQKYRRGFQRYKPVIRAFRRIKRAQMESPEHEHQEAQAIAQLLRAETAERKAKDRKDQRAWQQAESQEHDAIRQLVRLEKKTHPGLKLSAMRAELEKLSALTQIQRENVRAFKSLPKKEQNEMLSRFGARMGAGLGAGTIAGGLGGFALGRQMARAAIRRGGLGTAALAGVGSAGAMFGGTLAGAHLGLKGGGLWAGRKMQQELDRAKRSKTSSAIQSVLEKLSVPQAEHDVPARVEEIANAVRRDDRRMPDATAHRIAWRQFHREQGTKPETPKQPLTGYTGGRKGK